MTSAKKQIQVRNNEN